jgi:hypothetical protein
LELHSALTLIPALDCYLCGRRRGQHGSKLETKVLIARFHTPRLTPGHTDDAERTSACSRTPLRCDGDRADDVAMAVSRAWQAAQPAIENRLYRQYRGISRPCETSQARCLKRLHSALAQSAKTDFVKLNEICSGQVQERDATDPRMRQSMWKIALLVTVLISIGGWVWVLEIGIRWLIARL